MKPYPINILLAISTAVFPVSCRNHTPKITAFPNDVQTALHSAGSNASELVEVIHHYSESTKDSLKLKAAYFLITNMDQWHYYQGELLDNFLGYFKSVRTEKKWTGSLDLKHLDSLYGSFSYDVLKLKYDIQEVTKDQLIENIDLAFKVWTEQPWGKDYSFSQFCEYILPMKMGDEMPEYNRGEIYNQYNKLLDPIRNINRDAVSACAAINNKLCEKGWYLQLGTGFLPHFPASKLIEYQAGSCRDQSDLGAYVMRSVGIPVSIDFIPQWPTRSQGHDFNAVIDRNGKPIMFGTSGENPGFCRFVEVPKGKVYRRTIEKNRESLVFKKGKREIVPILMRNPYFRDVTDEYVKCVDISVPLIGEGELPGLYKHAYICLFNNKEWVPVHWGDINDGNVTFTKMETNIAYLAAYFDTEGVIPANYPFILQKDGKIKFLLPDKRHLIRSLILTQIFPVIPHYLITLDGQFQGSKSYDFKIIENLFNTSEIHGLQHFWNTVTVKINDSFRYVRYYRPRQCYIGEMEFYASGKKLSGKVISSGASLGDANQFTKDMAIDGNVATSFISKGNAPGWVGLDFGKAEKIDSIKFSPGVSVFGPRCSVIHGHKYELRYWDHGHWIIHDSSIAENASVTFNNIPSGALYQIHDLSKNVNERIFTIENGTQVWW